MSGRQDPRTAELKPIALTLPPGAIKQWAKKNGIPYQRVMAWRYLAKPEKREAFNIQNARRMRERWAKNERGYRRRLMKTKLARCHANLGRVCSDCGRTDAETFWSGRRNLCCACHRRGLRNGFCPAGHAMHCRGVARCRCELKQVIA